MRYISAKPKNSDIAAIANRDTLTYSIPNYQHYNWCLDILRSAKPRIIDPNILIPREEVSDIQNTMIAACIKYRGLMSD